MRHSSYIRTTLAAAVVLAVSTSTHAQATASATLSNFRVQVFDLNPSDGIPASVTFTDASAAQVYAQAVDGVFASDGTYSGPIGAALSAAAAQGAASSSGTTAAGDPFTLGAGPGASAAASTSGVDTSAYGVGYLLASGITLTANTLLVFSANTSGVAAAVSLAGETADGIAVISLNNADNSQSRVGQSYQHAGIGNSYGSSAPFVQASLVNLSGGSISGAAYVYAYATGQGAVPPPVPEPETYALMLAGFLAVGSVARRLNQR